MKKLSLRLGLFVLSILLFGQAAAYATPRTRVFQYGLGGYTGVRDTWISTADWDNPPQYSVNYGQNEQLLLNRDGNENVLLLFNLGKIPANSAVISATLSLYNTTNSGWDGHGNFARRINLFQVLRGWDEGNQMNSPIDAAGKHGATGDNAFDYYPGEGTDIPWATRGMAQDKDYRGTPECFAYVVNEGWYAWDVTGLVRAHVRGEKPNLGMVLRDATGYIDGNVDWRSFVSSQAVANPGRRPKLTVVYNPDAPFADAGPDQENLAWNGGSISLDGSGSHDRPGGDDASLTYSWRVVQPAYGSKMNTGDVLSTKKIAAFTPDKAGEWEIELRVTNNLNESATDTVRLILLSLRPGHPRIYLSPQKLTALKKRALPSSPRWVQLKENADQDNGEMHAKALVSQITGEASYCAGAIAIALDLIAEPADWATKSGDIALVYDWCRASLSPAQRKTFITYMNSWADAPHGEDAPGWGNYWPRYSYGYALIGLATFGDNPRAGEWLDMYRHRRFAEHDLELLDRMAEGGAWPEGTVYDWIANWPRLKALEAWRTATGENLFESTNWFRNRLGYMLLQQLPGLAENFGQAFHPYLSTGDAERNRGSMANYARIMGLILIERFSTLDLAQQLQGYLSAPPTDNTLSFLFPEEFIWFNPDQPSRQPALLTHYAPALGTVFIRSGWPSGAADTDTSPTYITFHAGDHFSYHQHYAQNSFTLFKHNDLAVDSGVYSGEGLSNHDINYYVRTIAHNTLVVYNPEEDFSSARPDASSNDGGQRSMAPASRSPETIDYLREHAVHYDTGDILHYQHTHRYTYAAGDATKAYNNPVYNQTMDAGLAGNVAKVSRFQREFVYLRPEMRGASDYVVLFDRVGVTQEAFSGQNTKLLFHTLQEPAVNGTAQIITPGETLYANADLARAVSGNGKLFIKVLLPPAHQIRKVGGRGLKSFWVFDANYDWHWDPNEPQPRPVNDFENIPYGEWRLEVEPSDKDLYHNFLTVLYPTQKGTAAMPAADTLTVAPGMSGVCIADPKLHRVVLFSSAEDGSPPAGTISYTYSETAPALNLLVDLAPGARYKLATSRARNVRTVTMTPDAGGTRVVGSQGVLTFQLGQ